MSRIGEEFLEADSLIVAAVFEELVKKLERREQVILFEQEIHYTIAERRSLHVHLESPAPIPTPPADLNPANQRHIFRCGALGEICEAWKFWFQKF